VANKAFAVPANFSLKLAAPAAQVAKGLPSLPIKALPSGFQNTLKPYAIPIDKCKANAAGGTNHRLKFEFAVMCSFDKKSAMLTPKKIRKK
jgi:hypothetical protein